ncbi:hypothetical protein BHE74_00003702 [Ensete ventricosum]|nr:hypothetical protein BHE74_00003702 [Ensete ventricosum]
MRPTGPQSTVYLAVSLCRNSSSLPPTNPTPPAAQLTRLPCNYFTWVPQAINLRKDGEYTGGNRRTQCRYGANQGEAYL